MATVADVQAAHTTTLNHIDALLDAGPAWNYLTPAGNVLSYTFSVATGLESDNNLAQTAFSAAQQNATRSMLAYISSLTGIQFSETSNGANARIHFSMEDIAGSTTAGLCSWGSSYAFDGQNNLTSYTATAYVYLDNVEFLNSNSTLVAGNSGYETLLHEMGHALGLKHPFLDPQSPDLPVLPAEVDNTSNTVMSYTESGGPYSTFRPYDVAALNWIYGGDGLGGKLGLNSVADGRYLTGSGNGEVLTTASGNDILQGLGGDDNINGGDGFDIALYDGARSNFTVSKSGSAFIVTDNTGALGADTLTGIERIKFNDKHIAFDVTGDAGKAYRLYQAAFDRAPDQGGLGFWINVLSSGNVALRDVANGFVTSQEFKDLYGTNPTAESVVTKLYNNVLHRAPEQGGFDFWVMQIKNGGPLPDVLEAFSESAENQAQVIGTIQNGMEYIPFG